MSGRGSGLGQVPPVAAGGTPPLTSVAVQDPITGNGTAGDPIGLAMTVDDPIFGSGTAADHLRVSLTTLSPLSGSGTLLDPLTADISQHTLFPVAGSGTLADPITSFLYATWDPTKVRYFLLDYDGGDDAHVGYIDAAAGTTLAPAGLAIKTFQRLFEILPPVGGGHRVVILVKPRAAGATYLEQDGLTQAAPDWSSFVGYQQFYVRGSTDLTNTATDRVLCGFITAVSSGVGDGSWTCLAGGTTTVFTVSAGSVGAEPACIQFRVRFKGNVTGALTNAVMDIYAHTTTQITVSAALPAAPAAGDQFFIERPGVRVSINSARLTAAGCGAPGSTFNASVVMVGLAATGSAAESFAISGPARCLFSGCETTDTTNHTQFAVFDANTVHVNRSYTDEAGTARNVGMGVRVNGNFIAWNLIGLSLANFGWVGAAGTGAFSDILGVDGDSIGASSYFGRTINVTRCGRPGATATTESFCFGSAYNASGGALCRCNGTVQFFGVNGAIAGVVFTNCVGSGAVRFPLDGGTGCTVAIDNCSGSSGNTGYGMDFSAGGNSFCFFQLGRLAANTVTGTNGDVQVGNAKTSHASFTVTDMVDAFGNRYVGTAGAVVGVPCLEMTNSTGGALAPGALVRQSGTNAVVLAEADSAADASGPLLVCLTTPANAATGLFAPAAAPMKWIQHDGAPTLGALSYVSVGTAGDATTTVPPLSGTNQKRRLGSVVRVSGTLGLVTGSLDNLPVIADGNP